MNKEYRIEKTRNGFIIKLEHKKSWTLAENQYVALTLEEALKIIETDLHEKIAEPEKIIPTENKE